MAKTCCSLDKSIKVKYFLRLLFKESGHDPSAWKHSALRATGLVSPPPWTMPVGSGGLGGLEGGHGSLGV